MVEDLPTGQVAINEPFASSKFNTLRLTAPRISHENVEA